MKTMKTTFWCFAILFAVTAMICYVLSIRDVGYDFKIANIQMTVFAAASAVLCGVNVVGAVIVGNQISNLEEMKAVEERIKKTFVGVLEEETKALKGNAVKTVQAPSKADLYIEKKKMKE